VNVKPEGGRLLLDGEAFTSKKIVPSELGPGEYTFTYELEGHRESIKFIINRSLEPSIIIHQIAFTAENGWDIAFSSNPTVIDPLGWQLDQYQYNDDNKETDGIFRSTFDPNVGEMKVRLEIHNPSPCHATYAYKKLLFEQQKEFIYQPLADYICSLDREITIIPVIQKEGIDMEANKITLRDTESLAKKEKKIIVPVYQKTESEFIFTVVHFLIVDASFKVVFTLINEPDSSEDDFIKIKLASNHTEGQSTWQVNSDSYENGADIRLKVDGMGETLFVSHSITFDHEGGKEKLEVEIDCGTLLETLRVEGTQIKNYSY